MMLTQFFAVVFVAATAQPAAATIEIEDGSLIVEGREFALVMRRDGAPANGVEIVAKYRENALERLQETQVIGKTGADGRLIWTPTQAGVVVLSWEGGTKNVKVRHDGAPGLGIVVMILAGVLLLGGTIFFFVQMSRGTE